MELANILVCKRHRTGWAQRTRRLATLAMGLTTVATFMELATSVRAQEAQRRQMEAVPVQPMSALSPQGSLPVAEDEEIGNQFLLKRQAAIPQFSISGDAQYFYNTNPRLVDSSDTSGDLVFVGSSTLAWNPTWIKGASLSAFVREQVFRYNENSALDFNSLAGGIAMGTTVKDWFNVSYGFTGTRLDSRSTDAVFYKEGDGSLVFSRVEKIGQRFALPYGYTMDYFLADPGSYTRITHGLFAGLNYVITPKLLAQVFYRLQYEDYQNIDRRDQAHIVSATVTYYITDWANVRAFMSWTTNHSTQSFSYDALNSGLGLSLVWRF
jgi:hypothetical protein